VILGHPITGEAGVVVHLSNADMSFCFTNGSESSSELLISDGVKVLASAIRAWLSSAACPTLNLKLVLAERSAVVSRKEKMNFIVVSPGSLAAAPFVGVPSGMIRDYGEKRFANIALCGLGRFMFR
jgi:hypothetical protein